MQNSPGAWQALVSKLTSLSISKRRHRHPEVLRSQLQGPWLRQRMRLCPSIRLISWWSLMKHGWNTGCWLGMIGMLVIHRRNLQHQTAEMLIRALWCKPNREDRQKAGLLTGAAPYTCRQHQHSSSFHPMTRLTANGSPTRDVTPCLSCLIWRDSLLFAQCYLLANCLAPGPNTSETWSPPLLTIGEYKLEEDIISADPGRRKGERARE